MQGSEWLFLILHTACVINLIIDTFDLALGMSEPATTHQTHRLRTVLGFVNVPGCLLFFYLLQRGGGPHCEVVELGALWLCVKAR